ncbi:fungal specific transcription factor domain-containing protein [Sarocladium implicatum]|nr:fungal specific transcription factor domain-containing protein [Sarocladium implicatum]
MALHKDLSATHDFPYLETPMALNHYNQAVSHVQKRMFSSEPFKSSGHELLGLVLGLASYDLSSGNMDRWKLHMTGLQTLIHRRGGLQAYPSVYFRLSLLWTEATGSLFLDLAPHFDIPLEIMQPYRKPVANALLERNLSILRSMAPQLDHMSFVMELMTGVSSSFVRQADNVREERDDDDYAVYCITRARTSYLLLRVGRLDPDMALDRTIPEVMIIGEMIRLSAMVFLLRLAGFTPGTVHHHTDRLLQLLGCCEGYWTGCEELQLWVFVITAVMMDSSGDCQEGLSCRIRDLLCHLGLGWDEVSDVLHNLPWVQSLFEPRLARLAS